MSFSKEGYHHDTDEGDALWFLDTLMTVKASGDDTHGAFTVIDCVTPGGFAPPLHVHHTEDEAFYVLSGQLWVTCGDQSWTATAGSFVLMPRDIPHAFVVTSDEGCRLLQITSGSEFERFLGEMGRAAGSLTLPPPTVPDFAALAAAGSRHGVEILGPPLSVATASKGAR